MTILFGIIGIIVAIYLVLVIPAGLAVYINERKLKKSPDRFIIEIILSEYKDRLKKLSKTELDNITNGEHFETIERDEQQYSIVYSAKRLNENKYRVIISVGKLSQITIGHASKFDIVF